MGNLQHGGNGTRLHNIWCHIRKRCVTGSAGQVHRYKGRGIKLCDAWMDFVVFRDWAMANGYADDLTIDRIDNDGDYCPENCRWISWGENSAKDKKEPVVCVETGEEFESASAASEFLGLTRRAVSHAIMKGQRAGGFYWRYKKADNPETFLRTEYKTSISELNNYGFVGDTRCPLKKHWLGKTVRIIVEEIE